MATACSVLSKEQLLCPICLDWFNQPVSTPCGHNFCRDCIETYWQSTNVAQCPTCKHKLYTKPNLKVNTFISEVAFQFRELTERKCDDEAVDKSTGQKGEVSCDICVGKQVTALKSCLDCVASFCGTHLEPHQVLGTLKTHRLIKPMMSTQDRVCEKHGELMDQLCNTDRMCVCQVCVKNEHRAHHTVRIEDESRDRRGQIERIQAEVIEMIQCRMQKVGEINQTVQLSRRNAEKETEESLQIFNKLLQLVQRGRAEVAEVIAVKQRQVETKANRISAQLEQEINQLRCKNDELEQLSHTEDDLYLVQFFPAFSTIPAAKNLSYASVEHAEHVGTVRRVLRRVTSQVEEEVKAEVKRLCATELLRAQQYAVDVTLDPDTAHPKLVLSESKKQVHHGDVALSVPDNSKRFYPGVSVLGKEGFSSGRFYYEVQVKGKTEWDIGVGLESVKRKGGSLLNPECGYWALGMRKDESYWALSSPPVCVPLLEKPERIAVYVDVDWGQVSFYNVDSQCHIYSFTGYTIHGKLFPYFNPRRNHGGTNSAPLVILPVHN
ncbi:E3 ubiquitin-protein ligase TRIM21-like [Pholidichthys leucotaenia]